MARRIERLGAAHILTDHQCVGLDQRERDVTLHFGSTTTGATRPSVTADIAISCDGVNSAVRRQFYPGEELCFRGINTWRGVTRAKPFLTGRRLRLCARPPSSPQSCVVSPRHKP